MATVGYGDISPESSAGKVVVSIMIMVALVVVPMQINRLTALITMQSKFRTRYKPSPLSKHVIVVGNVTNADLLRDFLLEFFHPERMSEGTEVVVLGPEEPPEQVQSLLVNPIFDGKVGGTACSGNDDAGDPLCATGAICQRHSDVPAGPV